MGLRPTRFEFKSENDDEVHAGFIAQEVSKLQSDLGVVIAEETELPQPDPDVPQANAISEELQTEWTINYSAIIAPLVAVVQSQQEEINDLKQKVSALSAWQEDKNGWKTNEKFLHYFRFEHDERRNR